MVVSLCHEELALRRESVAFGLSHAFQFASSWIMTLEIQVQLLQKIILIPPRENQLFDQQRGTNSFHIFSYMFTINFIFFPAIICNESLLTCSHLLDISSVLQTLSYTGLQYTYIGFLTYIVDSVFALYLNICKLLCIVMTSVYKCLFTCITSKFMQLYITYAPFQIVCGREARLPYDVMLTDFAQPELKVME